MVDIVVFLEDAVDSPEAEMHSASFSFRKSLFERPEVLSTSDF
jgi:hypothetical protein